MNPVLKSVSFEELKEVYCNCDICRSFCVHSPGWFLPSQIKEIEQFFKRSWKDLLGKELAINYFLENNNNVFVLAPNIIGNNKKVYPFDPRGQCIFFKEKSCDIYSIDPMNVKLLLTIPILKVLPCIAKLLIFG